MVFHRQWLLMLLAFLLGGGSVFAATTREERDYAAAVAAFHDELYGQAETELTQFIEQHPDSRHIPAAILLKAQAQFDQGKYPETLSTLANPKGDWNSLADQYAYWRGEAQFARNDYAQAATTFTNLAAQFPDSALRLTSVVEAATAFARLKDWSQLEALLEQTNGVFATQAATDAGDELIMRGRLLLVQARLAQKNYAGARTTLQLLAAQTLPPALEWQRASLQCQLLLGVGDLPEALAVTTNLLSVARQQPDAAVRLADSVALRGTVLERMGRWAEAVTNWQQNLAADAPADRQREAILKLAADAATQKKFTEAEAALAKFRSQFSNSPAADLALLTQGELNLKQSVAEAPGTNHLAAARQNFDQLLATNSAPPDILGQAFLDRGWCFWLARQYADSLRDFLAAVKRLPFSVDLAVARFKAADAQFALHDYSGARTNYEAVLNNFGRLPAVKSLGDVALYQIIQCNVKLKDASAAEQAMRRLLKEYPGSELADKGMLRLGQGLADLFFATNTVAGFPTNAVEVFHAFIKQFPHSSLKPHVEMELARTYERGQDWPAAMASYRKWLAEFPTNRLRPQVEYSLSWSEYQVGNQSNALAGFVRFMNQYPTNALAPMAQWWLADYYFRQGGTNYAEAEKYYEYIFQNTNAVWQQSDLFYPAQLMAGRAALGRQGYSDAAHYFSAMTADTNCPPELATKARFALGGVLMNWNSSDTNNPLANFELATNVFAQLAAANPTNEYGPLALSELGDCDLQLGDLVSATNAYTQAMTSPYAGVGLRCRAQVGLGQVLEKIAANAPAKQRKALLEQALGDYFQVFQTNLGKGLEDNETPEAFWVKKAGLQMLPLMITLKEGDLDHFFDRMERLLPPMKTALEKKRAALAAENN